MLSNPQNRKLGRTLPILLLPLALPLILAACSGSSSGSGGGSDPVATSATATTSGSGSAPTTKSAASGKGSGQSGSGTVSGSGGCAANGTKVPSGAGQAPSPDLDHDGKRDQVWLADSGTTRRLGVHTASGATFSTTFDSAAPQAASAIGQRLGDGSEIILLNTGRSVQLYAVVGCKIQISKNAQGQQYSFDLGFTGFGTGVRCVDSGRGLQVAGMLAEPKAGKYNVYQTRIALSDSGREARNIARQTLATKASAGNTVVKSAQGVSCGAGNPGAQEPQG